MICPLCLHDDYFPFREVHNYCHHCGLWCHKWENYCDYAFEGKRYTANEFKRLVKLKAFL